MNVKDALKEAISLLGNVEVKGKLNMKHMVVATERIEAVVSAIETAEKEVTADNDN